MPAFARLPIHRVSYFTEGEIIYAKSTSFSSFAFTNYCITLAHNGDGELCRASTSADNFSHLCRGMKRAPRETGNVNKHLFFSRRNLAHHWNKYKKTEPVMRDAVAGCNDWVLATSRTLFFFLRKYDLYPAFRLSIFFSASFNHQIVCVTEGIFVHSIYSVSSGTFLQLCSNLWNILI